MRVFHHGLLNYCHENAEIQRRKFDDVTLKYSEFTHPTRIFSAENINLESITFMKIKMIMNKGKLYIITMGLLLIHFSMCNKILIKN